jgi:hypothetical protein
MGRPALPDDVALRADAISGADEVPVISFLVELPMNCHYDRITGTLTVETPVVRTGEGPTQVLLRLQFSGAATHLFARALNALEQEADVVMTGRPGDVIVQ